MPARSAGPEMTAHSTTMAATIARSAHVTSYRLTGRNGLWMPSTEGYISETIIRSTKRHRWNTEKQEA